MASKKDFAGMNTSRVYSTLEQATGKKGQQTTASPQEAAQRAEEMKTQGRKGCKATRINMAFNPENYSFVRIMASASGKSMTEFTNLVIAAYRKEHPELMEQAQAFLNAVNTSAISSLTEDN